MGDIIQRAFRASRERLLNLRDAVIDRRVCGTSLVPYVPSIDRDDENGVGGTGTQSTHYALLTRIFSHVDLTASDSFIDVGCGKGRVLAYLMKEGCPCQLFGIEHNEKVAKIAQEWAERYDQVHVIVGDALAHDYNPYTVLSSARSFLPKTFCAFVGHLERTLTHPVRLVFWYGQEYYCKDLESRPGWEMLLREEPRRVLGLWVGNGYSVWSFDPGKCPGDVAVDEFGDALAGAHGDAPVLTEAASRNVPSPSKASTADSKGVAERISLSIEQWMALREGGGQAPPIWFTVVGGSMSPLIRKGRDQVMIVGVEPEEIKVGDIVLFPGHYRGGDYCLHRVYRLDGDMVQTFGDGNPGPDGWMARSRILGRAKLIRRGNRTIDCDDPRQRRRAARWCALWRVRPLLMLPHRFAGKAARVAKCVKAQVDEQTLSQRDGHGGGLPVETQCLIYLVACAVNRIAPEADLVADMDLDAVYQVASQHMLAATIAPALEAAGVKDDRFSSALQHSVLKNATMDAEMDALFAEMDAAGIWHMPLKGIVLQHMYPVYGMRQMSDHDILFDAVRADDVRAIMEGLGFSTEHFGESNHDVYHKEPVSNFEMHRALFGGTAYKGVREYYRDVQNRLLGDGYEKHLSPEDFYLYLTAHEHKHYSSEGTGLRSLLDTYAYLHTTELDMDYVAAEAMKMGVAEFESASRLLAQRLFSGDELTEADEEMLGYVMSSGVYGTRVHRVENTMASHGFGRVGYFLHRFLLPLDKEEGPAVLGDEYPFFYEHRALLPLLVPYRAFRVVFVKKGKFTSTMRAIRDAKA